MIVPYSSNLDQTLLTFNDFIWYIKHVSRNKDIKNELPLSRNVSDYK